MNEHFNVRNKLLSGEKRIVFPDAILIGAVPTDLYYRKGKLRNNKERIFYVTDKNVLSFWLQVTEIFFIVA